LVDAQLDGGNTGGDKQYSSNEAEEGDGTSPVDRLCMRQAKQGDKVYSLSLLLPVRIRTVHAWRILPGGGVQ
jgi:hypothetical protein